MDAGQRSARVQLQRRVLIPDNAGGNVVSWVVWATTWASVVPGSGREFWEYKHLMPTLSHMINMRYRPGVTPAMRVVCGQQVFNIQTVRNIAFKNIELELLCDEVVPA